MSAAEEILTEKRRSISKSKSEPFFNRALTFLSSVRFGVTLLCILVALSMVGMLIVQQDVNGFDAYFASLTPAEKTVYDYLGFFDIYHSLYFNLLLLVLSLNIVLASIDHFPSSWKYVSKPKLFATGGWLRRQKQNAILQVTGENENDIAEKIRQIFQENGFKSQVNENKNSFYAAGENGEKNFSRIESKNYLCVFGERGRLNRLGAYFVHVALLTLFLGHFVALQSGFDADVRMMPGQTTNEIQMIEFNLDKQERYEVALPFTCLLYTSPSPRDS